jgi:c-di-GMP-binding flagellar brake protein YcgR
MAHPHKVPLKFELSPAAGNDQYLVHSEMEIVFILRAIMHKKTPLVLYFNEGSGFILTSILDIDAERREIVLDYGANEESNRQALRAEKMVFITSHDRVKVQFICHRIEKIRFDDSSAFRTGIPESLLRMQRREYYRITTPAINPLKCTIPLPAGHTPSAVEVVLLDISCGGIAVIDHQPTIGFEPGVTYENCRITLPGIGELNATIRVKTTFDVTLKNNLACKRAGCEFVDMPEKTLSMIQRYIMKLERERRTK